MPAPARRAEIAALLAVAQDYAFGQPPGSQLRAVVLAQKVAEAAGLDEAERATTWWTSALRFLGCTGHAFETAVVFGDEIDLRAWSLSSDASNPVEFLREMLRRAGPGQTGVARLRAVFNVLIAGKAAAVANFQAACEVADAFAVRLGLDDEVRAALATNFERWNGRGLPAGVKSTAIPRPMRIAQIAQEFDVLAHADSVDGAVRTIAARRGKAYEPALVDVLVTDAHAWAKQVDTTDPWDAALALAPAEPPLSETKLQDALLVLADFADLKSPWTAGHSRRVAELAVSAAGTAAEAGALVHDLGRVGISNAIWDKPAALTRDERDRVEMHALITDQLVRRLPALEGAAEVASGAHERLNATGYYRRASAAQLDAAQRAVAAADCYDAMESERPHRPAMAPSDAARELRAMAADGRLDGEAVERVLQAAGHERRARASLPDGLTAREAEVLALLALGLTTREVADRLVISAKTADHHIQNVYKKIGVSTRGAAALYAIERGLLLSDA